MPGANALVWQGSGGVLDRIGCRFEHRVGDVRADAPRHPAVGVSGQVLSSTLGHAATIVADTQRLTLDHTSGHSVHEPLSEYVPASYRHLVDAGYTQRVVVNPHPFGASGVTQQRVR